MVTADYQALLAAYRHDLEQYEVARELEQYEALASLSGRMELKLLALGNPEAVEALLNELALWRAISSAWLAGDDTKPVQAVRYAE